MSTLLMDLRLAIRGFRNAPSFTALVLVILTVGIGATTAIFSAVNDLMFHPLAGHDPERLVMLWVSNEERGGTRCRWHRRTPGIGASR